MDRVKSIKKQIFANIQKLDMKVMNEIMLKEEQLFKKILTAYVDVKPTAEHFENLNKVFHDEGNSYELRYNNGILGTITHEMIDEKLTIRFDSAHGNQ